MVMKVSLGSIKNADKQIGREISRVSNSDKESLEEYVKLINLVRQGFSGSSKRLKPGPAGRIT